MSLDGSTFDVADQAANEAAFGRPGASRGSSAYPQIRFVSLVENGTHVLFGNAMAGYATGEITLAKAVLGYLQAGMLCMADRQFFGFALWELARQGGADLLWRIKKNICLPCEQPLPDGSYLSRIYQSAADRRRQNNGIVVRVIDYALDGVADAEPIYRLVTTILDHQQAPATELAALYHERWEIETAFDDLPYCTPSYVIEKIESVDWDYTFAEFLRDALPRTWQRRPSEAPKEHWHRLGLPADALA